MEFTSRKAYIPPLQKVVHFYKQEKSSFPAWKWTSPLTFEMPIFRLDHPFCRGWFLGSSDMSRSCRIWLFRLARLHSLLLLLSLLLIQSKMDKMYWLCWDLKPCSLCGVRTHTHTILRARARFIIWMDADSLIRRESWWLAWAITKQKKEAHYKLIYVAC